ncbi:MAG: hypothetical protein WKG32_21200 [Gemmatimonadaceae bacterium]
MRQRATDWAARAAALAGAVVMPAVAVAAACSPVPASTNDTVAQTVIEMSDAVNALQGTNADLQGQIDSLRTVLAQQDTVIRRLANLAGVPLPPPPVP